ncbi:uncharacterized protein LOC129717746 [Wyeomyia smithii]|uniref:uncharacterized protein LOC129717746 n=1 Tax=Wyeomyia smithii TaxID=174621 RepID=UPI0024681E0A|nr:uncharacterized protein LOC129717746 [Wyeomyia smithii]
MAMLNVSANSHSIVLPYGEPDAEQVLPDYCRLCLAENVQMVVPKDDKALGQLATKIRDCLNMSIPAGELNKSMLCKKCYECLEQFHQFRARCSRYATYLAMRKTNQPDRKQLLRYGENWYWYSCMGKNLQSVHWGCSVVCCPAYIVTYPSGKVCAKYAQHLHKQKMEEVKQLYNNGEFVYDGFRFSFDLITQNRTLLFSCKSLNDPNNKCNAVLITNDRSEVLSAGNHNHARETIIESAVIDAEKKVKQSIALIRGPLRELALCQGFWYETVSRQSNISYWNCIRTNCLGSMTMTNGIVEFHGVHFHLPVWLKWGALANKLSIEPKPAVLMKVINPQKRVLPGVPAGAPQELPPTPVHKPPAQAFQQPKDTIPLLSDPDIKVEISDVISDNPEPCEPIPQPAIVQFSNSVFSKHNITFNPETAAQPTATPHVRLPNKSANVEHRQVHKVHQSARRLVPSTEHQIRKPCPIASTPLIPSAVANLQGMPKILHVMSLNKDAAEKDKQLRFAMEQANSGDTSSEVSASELNIKQELDFDEPEREEEEPETITDEIIPVPPRLSKQKPPSADSVSLDNISDNNLPIMSMSSSISVASFASMAAQNSTETDDDNLNDLQDDEEVPPIIPIDVTPFRNRFKQQSARVVAPKPLNRINSAILIRPQPKPGSTRPTTLANKDSGVRVSSLASVKRFSSINLHNTTIKRVKCTRIIPEAESTDLEAEDPIAVPTEPHEKIESSFDEEYKALNDDDQAPPPSVSPLQNSADEASNDTDASMDQNRSNKTSDTDMATDVISADNPRQIEEPSPAAPEPASNPLPERETPIRKKQPTKTVQLVKLQKSDQMLNYEGHLYKIKWFHEHCNYWDCMLREQVHCGALLETRGNNQRLWTKYGMHNHKVPKPITNEDGVGKYQMLASTGIPNVKVKQVQTVHIADIKEQEGQMMHLKIRRTFSFAIKLEENKVKLHFANYIYEVLEETKPGFRCKCITCPSWLDTDEMFSIAKQFGGPHNHEPVLPVIDLIHDDVTKKPEKNNDKTSTPESDETPASGDSVEQTTDDDGKTNIKNDDKKVDDDDDGIEDLFPKTAEPTETTSPNEQEELSDDDEIVLDPLSGEFCKKSDIRRRENRALLLGSNEDDDDDAEVLDPLTGQFRRKGDITEIVPFDTDPEVEENTQQFTPEEDLPNEDFEELLKGTTNGEPSTKKPKNINPNSLAALKREIAFYQRLREPNPDRNFEVLPQENESCFIRFNQFNYQLDKIDKLYSVWKCVLSPQYACRGKIHLNENCRTAVMSGVNHCHPASTEDMFLARPQEEEGYILDSIAQSQRQYTFYKRPKNVFLLKLDDGYFYSCLTISKTDVSCWRCAQRQTYGCKAILTMEGNFRSMARNRFTHSHEQPVEEPTESESKRTVAEGVSGEVAKEKDTDKKSKKRQTL